MEKIQSHGFSYCNSLEKIIFKKNVAYFGEFSFANCPQLKTFYFEGTTDVSNYENNFFMNTNIEMVIVTNNYPQNTYCQLSVMKKSGECGNECVYSISTDSLSLHIYSPKGNKVIEYS